jgi:hypothetical protein
MIGMKSLQTTFYGNFDGENDETWDGIGYPIFRRTKLGLIPFFANLAVN